MEKSGRSGRTPFLEWPTKLVRCMAADLKDKLVPAYADLQRKWEAVQTVMGTITSLINTYVPGRWQGVAVSA